MCNIHIYSVWISCDYIHVWAQTIFSSKSVELYLYLLFCSVEVLYDVKSIVQFQEDYRCRCLLIPMQLLSLVVQK